MMDSLFEFKVISKHRMVSHYYLKFERCLESLNNDQIWFKESDDLNSIGGIIVHIIEHIQRNTQRIMEPGITYKFGIENTFTDLKNDKKSLQADLKQTFLEFEYAISKAEAIDMYNIYHLVEHTGYHLGQVVDRAQRVTGERFQFVQSGINEKTLKNYIEKDISSG